jgi:hypothetical protein
MNRAHMRMPRRHLVSCASRPYIPVMKNPVKSTIRAGTLALATLSVSAPAQQAAMKIQLELDGSVLTATLADNAAARDFASLLPLRLTLKDYAATEKVADLPRKLSTQGAPAGFDPDIGHITFYAPWGNLAIFYKDFGYSAGLVNLGRIDSGIAALQRPGPLQVTIRKATE